PNAALSQAKRVTVHSWRSRRRTWSAYLDVDEVVSGDLCEIPQPVSSKPPHQCPYPSGTIIHLTKCDRLDTDHLPSLVRRLRHDIGRRFRHHLWRGVSIHLNDKPVPPI